MGRRCCIAGCSSSSRLPEHQGVTYHSFPLDPNTRSVWLRLTRLSSERQITKSVLVCSRHFRRVDFQPQRSGKYLLKQKVFPTVFPWGKRTAAEIEADNEFLKSVFSNSVPNTSLIAIPTRPPSAIEEDTKATVAATVAQIMAQTAELNASGPSSSINMKTSKSETKMKENVVISMESSTVSSPSTSTSSNQVRFEPVTVFSTGARLEAQDFDGIWHPARIVEVDNDDCEVLIKFEKTGKSKSIIVGSEEWIPMNSTRLRKKIATKPLPTFMLEEKCMARWSGPKKFPGTIKKILSNDVYEVLFDDGYIKNVRAVHMSKFNKGLGSDVSTPSSPISENVSVSEKIKGCNILSGMKRPALDLTPTTSAKKKVLSSSSGSKRDWPLLDLSKIDLDALNLPHIPTDGEWTCYWVNDQPIGKQGFLMVGDHRKPTVIVDDWRLPSGWVKHMYQRSNVLGKWDVILVTPSGKRFRSKSDLKVYLEEQNLVYNPDVYDFSIHRRRAKDLNCYVYTPDYVPQFPVKAKSFFNEMNPDTRKIESPNIGSHLGNLITESKISVTSSKNSIMDDRNITEMDSVIPKQLLYTEGGHGTSSASLLITDNKTIDGNQELSADNIDQTKPENGFVVIGDLKVQIVDNLFRCPQEGCTKNFRKENHLQIHVKHYHRNLVKLLGSCPKMLELAKKLSHPEVPDVNEQLAKYQLASTPQLSPVKQQQFTDTLNKIIKRTSILAPKVVSQSPKTMSDNESATPECTKNQSVKSSIKKFDEIKFAADTSDGENSPICKTQTEKLELDVVLTDGGESTANEGEGFSESFNQEKMLKFSLGKRSSGFRKSNRQRTTRRYIIARQNNSGSHEGFGVSLFMNSPGDNSFGDRVTDMEETRHSFNATPEMALKKRKILTTPVTPLSGLDSPITADSGSGSFAATSSNENDMPQYIKENGELIKIVHMRQEEIINCICGYGEEDGLMIQCELCLCWQHGFCNNIDKESQVPEKYICFICRNPQGGRESLRYRNDQDWLFEGKLPVANYHQQDFERQNKRSDILKRSHTCTGNLLELKDFMHSLRVKLNIAGNKQHPKLYLWAKKWKDDKAEESLAVSQSPGNTGDGKQNDVASVSDDKYPDGLESAISNKNTEQKENVAERFKAVQENACPSPVKVTQPHVPQPEAAIDSTVCQQNLLEHIKTQQSMVLKRLAEIENVIDSLEKEDEMTDMKDVDMDTTSIVNRVFIKELETMKQLTKLNFIEHNNSRNKTLMSTS